MKNKSSRHKQDNTFKFIPFSERINNVNINVFHRIGHENESETDLECYFYEAIQKWNVLNLSVHFGEFKKEVRVHTIVTLPQLVHNKDVVVEVLMKYLKEKNVLSLQPLLELVVALAQDLRNDFYSYYQQFLEIIIDLLNTKEIEQLEWSFTCLAHLFKILWRILLKNVNVTFNTLLPLLSDEKPEYINNFAAESFAFVARKVKDKRSFLLLIVRSLKHNKNSITGSGKLLFEVISSVQSSFYSNTEEWLNSYIDILNETNLPKIYYEIFEEIIQNIIENIRDLKSVEIFWKIFLDKIENFTDKNLNFLLKCLGIAVEYKNGLFLKNPPLLTKTLKRIIESGAIYESKKEVLLTSTKITLLLLQNFKLQQEESSLLIKTMLNLNDKEILLYFIENTFDCSLFEALILPNFLKLCLDYDLNRDFLRVLTKLIVKKSDFSLNGISLNKNEIKLNLKFKKEIEKRLIKNLSGLNEKNNEENYIYSVIILPYFCSDENILKILIKNLKTLTRKIEKLENIENDLFLFSLTFKSFMSIKNNIKDIKLEEEMFLKEIFIEVMLPLTTEPKYILALQSLDLFLTINTTFLTKDLLIKLNKYLEKNFSSPHHQIRLYTTHIYSLFDKLFTFPEMDLMENESFNVFGLCYKVESIETLVETYREQLMLLERLNFDKPQMKMCERTEFQTIPLRYLCGLLYVNFKLLWDPICKIISSYAFGMDREIFWGVFGEELKKIATICVDLKDEKINDLNLNTNINSMTENVNSTIEDLNWNEFNDDFLIDLYKKVNEVDSKIDFINYRILLWKCLQLFPEIAEVKNRDVSVLMLNFIEKEYMTSNTDSALTWNIKQNDSKFEDVGLEENDKENYVENGNEENNQENYQRDEGVKSKNQLNKYRKSSTGKSNLRTLLQHLLVFSKFKDPKSIYRERELHKIYYDFLSHKNPDVQKTALDCLMTYKFKYLTPYSDHLYKLIDEKNFKNELVTFNIDEESNFIKPEHREDLILIVTKLIFAKMTIKSGLKGAHFGQIRRNLIFRFLSGLNTKEMKSFVQMSFRFYEKFNFFEENFNVITQRVEEIFNLEKFIPPKRLQSTLNMIEVIFDNFGGLMDEELLRYLLKLIIFIGVHLKLTQENLIFVHKGYFGILKNLKSSCLKLIYKFFENFDRFSWKNEEINVIFDVFIFPFMEKLEMEGIHSPTNLLKLFICWGSNPRYFDLLIKYFPEKPNEYPLKNVIKLLINEKTHFKVCNLIMEMIVKLLCLESNEDELKNELNDLQIDFKNENLLKIDLKNKNELKIDSKINRGSLILLPHVDLILEKVKINLEKSKKNVKETDLIILTRLSELNPDEKISDNLLKLIVPIVLKRFNEEKDLLKILESICNLIGKVDNPEKHFNLISPLFAEVNFPSCRKILLKIIEKILEKDFPIKEKNFPIEENFSTEKENLKIEEKNFKIEEKNYIELINSLNAYDKKWIDQIDFKKRLEAFKILQKLINEIDFEKNLNFGILLIHNNFYYLKYSNDISLKENAIHTLKNLSVRLIESNEKNHLNLTRILDETLFNLIKSGIKINEKSSKSDFREDCIKLLGYLARNTKINPILRDLNKLTNVQDVEVDFFENITHLQLYRHGKGLKKVCFILKEDKFNTKTLTQFILPLTTYYLCNEKFSGKNHIIDASIEAIGVISKLLPWPQYEGLLKFYLSKLKKNLQFQKQIVRLIVCILDSFHFDLSKGYYVDENDKFKNDDKNNEANNKNNEEIDKNFEGNDKNVEEIDKNIEEIDEEMKEIDEEMEEIDENNEEIDENKLLKPFEKVTVLSPSSALRVINTIKNVLLPQLNRCLAEMTHYETNHKVNRKKTCIEREEEDLLRVPISLALVKLLLKLPKAILDANISGILLKLCIFLKSQLESVRRVARESLQKIMLALGPSYLKLLLDEIIPLLSRGFQVHVLVYTVHSVLNCMKDVFTPGDVDRILSVVIKLCNTDLFGVLSEEKEILKITTKTSEAKSSKSMDTFKILAEFITETSLRDLLNPIKDILINTHSYKIVKKVQEAFKHIALGLIDNKLINVEVVLKFSFDVVFETFSEIDSIENRGNLGENESDRLKKLKPDCFIIEKEPVYKSGRRTLTVKASNVTNMHILVEFGLKLCYFLLKRDVLKENIDENLKILGGFIPIMVKCLQSKDIKLCTVTLQCLPWIFKHDPPSLRDHIDNITEIIFNILHKYAAAGLSKGDNFDLVVASFKAVTVLVRDINHHTIKKDQLKILLLYIEQDLHDHDRQATAFGLLKALLSRKFTSPELYDVIKKIMELSITSEFTHIRSQSRSIAQQFILDYPIGKKLETYLSFYLSQLKFELQTGRESAIEMIQSLITTLPIGTIKEFSGTIFISLGARLINDSEPNCRKMIADCLETLLKTLPKEDRDKLFDVLIVWLKDDLINHRRLSVQICGIFIKVERNHFESRLNELLPLIINQFLIKQNSNENQNLEENLEENLDEENPEKTNLHDHLLYQLLQMLLKLSNFCPEFLKKDSESIEIISIHVQNLLSHPHEWVRLSSNQFIGYVLNTINIEDLSLLIAENKSKPGYLTSKPIESLKSLTLDLCDQLHSLPTSNLKNTDFYEQIVKNLVFIARVLEKVPKTIEKLNLTFLIKRLRKVIHKEIIEDATNITMRREIFKFIAGVTIALKEETILENLHHLIAPLVREMMTTDEKDAPLRQLSKEIGAIIKGKIGLEKYTEVLGQVQQRLSVKRAERKRKSNQLAVTDPELYAKKKIKRHEKKKETKKRKISERKGIKRKFRKKEGIELDSSEIL